MRQLLLRVPDDVHARLTERARQTGRSANALATEILDRGIEDETGDARAAVRAKARRLGVLAARSAPPLPAANRERGIASTRGIGPLLDRLREDGR